jgi:hypothetical protein
MVPYNFLSENDTKQLFYMHNHWVPSSCIQERGENIPAEESFNVEKRIKEMYGYTS